MSNSVSRRPSSVELRSLSTFRYEIQNIETKLKTCPEEELVRLQIVYSYLKNKIDDIASRL